MREVRPFDPVELLRHLHEHRVEHIIIGALAVSAHGHVHAATSLEIVPEPSPENLDRLTSALAVANALDADGGQPDQAATSGVSRCLATDLGALRVIRRIPGTEAESLYANLDRKALPASCRASRSRVCGLSHLRAMTQASGRAGDLAVLERLGTD